MRLGRQTIRVKPRHVTDPDEARATSALYGPKYGSLGKAVEAGPATHSGRTGELRADPDRYVSRQRLAVSVAFLAFGAVAGSWVPRLPAIKDHLRLSDGQIGYALLAFAVGAVIGAGVARLVLARGARRWVRGGTVALCAATIVPALAGSFPALLAALLLLGCVHRSDRRARERAGGRARAACRSPAHQRLSWLLEPGRNHRRGTCRHRGVRRRVASPAIRVHRDRRGRRVGVVPPRPA